eukprot:TRINITY_DN101245_c0_g2_i2.p2 TRINITY_DN101245_c0_g2~~TRINITY_DN101245_c0_g2_i2.p2  ORF type:complete len:165 (+),score=11.39 TRINITY_DN101245_c0_g2_i2:108-602(+)
MYEQYSVNTLDPLLPRERPQIRLEVIIGIFAGSIIISAAFYIVLRILRLPLSSRIKQEKQFENSTGSASKSGTEFVKERGQVVRRSLRQKRKEESRHEVIKNVQNVYNGQREQETQSPRIKTGQVTPENQTLRVRQAMTGQPQTRIMDQTASRVSKSTSAKLME